MMTDSTLLSKYSDYRYCIARDCKNTSMRTPGKLWIRVPSDINKRNAWLIAAKRDYLILLNETDIYFCGDHFDLENDMENFLEYKVMGSVENIQMKPNCIPSRFDGQSDGKSLFTEIPEILQQSIYQTATKSLSEDNKNEILPMVISTSSFNEELVSKEDALPSHTSTCSVQVVQHNTRFCDQALYVQPLPTHANCQKKQRQSSRVTQAYKAKHCRSKRVQT